MFSCTNMERGVESKSNEVGWKELGIFNLKKNRLREDLIRILQYKGRRHGFFFFMAPKKQKLNTELNNILGKRIFFYCSPSLHHLSFQDCIFISGDRLVYIRKIWQAIMSDSSSSLQGYMSSNSALHTSDMHMISPFLLLIFLPRKLLKGCYCTN